MAQSINGIAIPLSIRQRGTWHPVAYAEQVINGAGATKTAGLGRGTWTFPRLSPADFAWWRTTILGGNPSVTVPAVLLNDIDQETVYSSVTVRYPTWERRENGYYINVVIEIDSMVQA